MSVSSNGDRFAAARGNFIILGTLNPNTSEPGSELDETRLLHTSRITALDFSPDGARLLSAGLDCVLFVWEDHNDSEKFKKLISCHSPLGITAAKWLNNNTIVTVGTDALVRTWKI